jgi:hypothetical protein
MDGFIREKMHQIFVNLSSVMVLFVTFRSICSKIIKIFRSIPIINIFKIITTIIFISQAILLTIDYLKYESVIDLKLFSMTEIVKKLNDSSPAISLCLKSSKLNFDANQSITIRELIGELECDSGIGITIDYLYFLRKKFIRIMFNTFF